MKLVKLICPKCGHVFYFKNYWSWVLHSPFHFFAKRLTKCRFCEEKSWMKKEKNPNIVYSNTEFKIGRIMQSRNATPEEVKKVYDER